MVMIKLEKQGAQTYQLPVWRVHADNPSEGSNTFHYSAWR